MTQSNHRWRVLIVDDERLARVALRSVLAERADVEIVGEADSVASARRKMAELSPDLIFLDVNMPGGSGFELFREPVSARVVFCTAYEQFAVRAFEVNALDYLVKPVGPEQIERALSRVPAAPVVASGLTGSAATGSEAQDAPLVLDDLVALRESHALRFVRVRDIVHLRAADDYSEVHLSSGRPALVDVTLRRWELRLPPADFVRIHRSSLVNLHHIDEVRYIDGRWEIAMRSSGESELLTVSRRVGRELGDRLRQRSVRVL
jgi:two-component system LytT family response regulator